MEGLAGVKNMKFEAPTALPRAELGFMQQENDKSNDFRN